MYIYVYTYSLGYQKVKCFNVNSNFIQFVSYCMNVAYFIYTSREINLVFEIRNCSIINGKTLNLYKLFKLFFHCEKAVAFLILYTVLTIQNSSQFRFYYSRRKNRLNAYIFFSFLFSTAHFS